MNNYDDETIKLRSILQTMDVPEMRMEVNDSNLRWLMRNMAVKNSKHPDFEKAEDTIKFLLKNKPKNDDKIIAKRLFGMARTLSAGKLIVNDSDVSALIDVLEQVRKPNPMSGGISIEHLMNYAYANAPANRDKFIKGGYSIHLNVKGYDGHTVEIYSSKVVVDIKNVTFLYYDKAVSSDAVTETIPQVRFARKIEFGSKWMLVK